MQPATSRAFGARDIAHLDPLERLGREGLVDLARRGRRVTAAPGQYLLRNQRQPARRIYLLAGTAEIIHANGRVRAFEAGTPEARYALGSNTPQAHAARAKTQVVAFEVDRDLLDLLLHRREGRGYALRELQDGFRADTAADDWVTRLLRTSGLRKVPPANIQAILMRMERISFRAGDAVIRQNDEGEYFYVVGRGRCVVTRRTPAAPKEIVLAHLRPGDTFGEEALISRHKRNATVTMHTDGSLMRLPKSEFLSRLADPLLHRVDYSEAEALAADGARWIDVRAPAAFAKGHVANADNIPLFSLRIKAKLLNRAKTYLLYCNSGRLSAVAAFLLTDRGFSARVLRDGLSGVPGEAIRSTASDGQLVQDNR